MKFKKSIMNFKMKLKIIKDLLFNNYIYSKRNKCFWLFSDKNNEDIIICYGKDNFHMFDLK